MAAPQALATGTALQEYRIESLLGSGGFGLTYLATDQNLNLKVALKEYLPAELAVRGDDSAIEPRSKEVADTFGWGLRRFLDESRTLASFRHPNIVRVMRFFEANRTAYMVMEFVEGAPLADWIKARRPLPQAQVLALALPLLDGLAVVHDGGYLHRDIKPGNIFIRADGGPVLLDFGSARQTMKDTELTAVVSPGWAPFEQYHSHGKQGPWSDLYALGGVLYWIVTGEKPVEAAARVRDDPMKGASQAAPAGAYHPDFLLAIDWALQTDETRRPQSAKEWRAALADPGTVPERTVPVGRAPAAPAKEPTPVSMPTGAEFDREALKKVEAELAQHLGPIAGVVVKKAAKTSMTLAALAEAVAGEIADPKAKAAFLKRFSGKDTTQPSQPVPATGLTQMAASRFDAQILQTAEKRLSEYIGAVAKVVVKRAAAKARDEGELYLLIADEIADRDERKAFIRKAISITGKG
jgi:hypothetical protein